MVVVYRKFRSTCDLPSFYSKKWHIVSSVDRTSRVTSKARSDFSKLKKYLKHWNRGDMLSKGQIIVEYGIENDGDQIEKITKVTEFDFSDAK